MRNNHQPQSKATVSSFQIATCAGNALPPTNFVDTLLAELFPEENSKEDVLTPFDYEDFLRREGFIC